MATTLDRGTTRYHLPLYRRQEKYRIDSHVKCVRLLFSSLFPTPQNPEKSA